MTPWILHESPSGNFSIRFPHEPVRSRARGGREIRYTDEYDSGRRLLRTSYERDLKASDTLESRLAEVVKQPEVVGSVKTTPISLGRHRGLECSYLMRSGTATLRARHRIYQVGSMSYQLLALADKEVDAAPDFDRFFNSFQILSISGP